MEKHDKTDASSRPYGIIRLIDTSRSTDMKRPLSITIVGTTLLLLGLYVGLVMVMEALQHRFFLNFAALMVPIGIGVLRCGPASAWWARVSVVLVGLSSAGIVLRFVAGTHAAFGAGLSLQVLAAFILLILSPFAWLSLGKLNAGCDLKAVA